MKIGFLGAGAMGGAILRGIVKAGVVKEQDVYVADASEDIKNSFKELGCNICDNNTDLKHADIIVLAVKPQYASEALKSLENSLEGKAVISIMAGIKVADVRSMIKANIRLLRTMPNTPALVNTGAFALCTDTDFNDEEKAFAEKMFGSLGIFEWMNEFLIDAATGLSGSGPAYVYMFIEALADGGVMEGLPRKTALRLAAQTVMGSAKMVLETGVHPDELKDRVCSPGGNTIVGVATLEEHGFRGACIDAVHRGTVKARELGNK